MSDISAFALISVTANTTMPCLCKCIQENVNTYIAPAGLLFNILSPTFPLAARDLWTCTNHHALYLDPMYVCEYCGTSRQTRKERFMGWYHSHPFDVEVHSHCFLSSTDISTQLSWQRAEDPHGNPWLAIVVGFSLQKSPQPIELRTASSRHRRHLLLLNS